MKKLLTVGFLLMLSIASKAQQNYFVYMQADNKQPFFVKMNDKVLSSSPSGYIVIPKLTTGEYSLVVGFPKDVFPEQTLALIVGNTDAGYLLKNFAEKGWGLYNIQTMEVTMSGAPAKLKVGNGDVFSNSLSGAANVPVATVNTTPVTTTPVTTTPLSTTPVAQTATAIVLSAVQKIDGTDAPEGQSMVYTVSTNNGIDTVHIFIPAKNVSVNESPVANQVVAAPAAPATEKDKKFLDMQLSNPNASQTPVAATPAVTDKGLERAVSTINSNCRATATDEDFIKIRRRIVAETNEDNMVDAARRYFKTKCFSTAQLKNLSALFLTDSGKYKFFEAAYPFTTDSSNFGSLQSELHDDYYLNRFRAMVRN